MPLPLEGIRVVDFSRVLAGPHCAKTLLDLGAEVIKLEPPSGDLSRKAFPSHGEISGYYAQQNAGKRNVSIDLNVPGAREVALRLCDTADVIVENFRPGALGAFGLDYESVSARNPGASPMSLVGSMSFPFYLAAMRRPDLGKDPRFLTPELRLRNLEALHRIVQEWIWTFGDMETLDAQLDEAKIATGRVRSTKEFADGDWARTWNAVRAVSDRSGGEIKIPGRPWHFADQVAADEDQLAARQGEHNADVLKELGFSAAQIGAFEASGALVQPSGKGAAGSSPDSALAPDVNAEATGSLSLQPEVKPTLAPTSEALTNSALGAARAAQHG